MSPRRDPLVEACQFASRIGNHQGKLWPAAREVLRHPVAAASYVQILRSTPQQDVRLQGRGAAQFTVGLDTARTLIRGVTQPVAALTVPEDDEIYLRGRRKQALRTNIHRAHDAGSVAQPATEPDQLHTIDQLVARRHHDDNWGAPPQLVLLDELVVIAGWDASGRPLVVAAAWTCSPWALLSIFVRVADGADASACRHLTQLEMVRELRRRGIRWFVAGPALSVPTQLRYLHHLWGFDPVRLRLQPASCAGDAAAPTAGRPGRRRSVISSRRVERSQPEE